MRNYKVKHDHQTRMIRPKLMRNFLRGDDYPGTYPARKHWAGAARDIVRQIEQRKRDEARKVDTLIMAAGGVQ